MLGIPPTPALPSQAPTAWQGGVRVEGAPEVLEAVPSLIQPPHGVGAEGASGILGGLGLR